MEKLLCVGVEKTSFNVSVCEELSHPILVSFSCDILKCFAELHFIVILLMKEPVQSGQVLFVDQSQTATSLFVKTFGPKD